MSGADIRRLALGLSVLAVLLGTSLVSAQPPLPEKARSALADTLKPAVKSESPGPAPKPSPARPTASAPT